MKEGRGPFTGFGHKPRGEGSLSPFVLATNRKGEGRPRSFHPLVLATKREVKEAFHPLFWPQPERVTEGRGPFTPFTPWFWPQTERCRKAAVLSPLRFGHTPRGRGPLPLGVGHTPRGEGRPRSFHPSVLATNRQVKEGRGRPRLSLLGFGNKPTGEGRPRKAAVLSPLGFGPFWHQTKPRGEGSATNR